MNLVDNQEFFKTGFAAHYQIETRAMKRGTVYREQRPTNLLSREENEFIFNLFGPRCESLATTVVQVFVTTSPDHCEWSKIEAGVLCLVKDHLKRSYYFRLYCPERRSLVWEHEVYNSMQYNAPKPFLHTFEAQDCIVAFNFASEEEANWLRSILLDKLESKKQRREKRLRNSYYQRESSNAKHAPHMGNGVVPTPNNKYAVPVHTPAPTGISFNTNKGIKKKNKKKELKKLSKSDIGTPTQFRHVSHVGFDVNKGFDANLGKEESPELKAFFEKAGVSETQLQDDATRVFIYDFINHNGGIDRVVNEVSQVDTHNKKDTPFPGGTRHDRESLPQPPPLPERNPTITSRAAPPPPPFRTLPAPPPPTQTPPPPPPFRHLPQHPRQPPSAGAPPPPPPPPLPAAIPPPPLPSTPAPDMDHPPSATPPPDTHSALMASIRSGTSLRKVDVEPESKTTTDARGDLLTQIRQGISLRPVQPMEKSAASGPSENSLADALARALALRSRVTHSDTDEDDDEDDDYDDDEWDD